MAPSIAVILGGNLSFLNWLTLVPALACFDDLAWKRVLPRAWVRRAERAADEAAPCRPQVATCGVLAGLTNLGRFLNPVNR